jgi:hypothetical protein
MSQPIKLASVALYGIDAEQVISLLGALAESRPTSQHERQAAAILRRKMRAQIDEYVKEHGE